MEFNPFDYWPMDPNGYLRHFAIGACLLTFQLVVIRASMFWCILWAVALAVGKEIADWVIKDLFSFADIAFTILPVALALLASRTMNR